MELSDRDGSGAIAPPFTRGSREALDQYEIVRNLANSV